MTDFPWEQINDRGDGLPLRTDQWSRWRASFQRRSMIGWRASLNNRSVIEMTGILEEQIKDRDNLVLYGSDQGTIWWDSLRVRWKNEMRVNQSGWLKIRLKWRKTRHTNDMACERHDGRHGLNIQPWENRTLSVSRFVGHLVVQPVD